MRKNSTRIILVAITLFLNTSLIAANFVVTSAADSGPGTLRQALADADNSAGADVITFNIGFQEPIILASSLQVNSPVFINGYGPTAGDDGTITGRSIVIGIIASGFDAIVVNSGDVSIAGLAIYSDGNPRMTNGISIGIAGGVGAPVKIWGNYIGADEFASIPNNSGASNSGVNISQENAGFYSYANPRVIVGTDGDGVNDDHEGNLISNNTTAGVYVGNADNIVIAGNWLGTQANGSATAIWQRGNGVGVLLDGQNAGNGSANNRVGSDFNGTSDNFEKNVISGNRQNGVVIQGRSSNNTVAGNNIGLNAEETNPGGNKGNSQYFEGNGVLIYDAPNNNIIGNIIASNNRNGMTIFCGNLTNPSSGNNIMGNDIGTQNGSNAYGNGGWGIQLINFGNGSVVDNIIGSNDDGTNDAGEANTIRFNTKDGVSLSQTSTGTVARNRISRNIFGGNNGPSGGEGAGLAINLLAGGSNADGITVNDAGDTDAGANALFNYPVVTQFGVDPLFVSIVGTVNAGATMQFYLASADAAPANPNYKEGSTFLINATDNGPGDDDPTPGAFSFLIQQSDLATPVAAGVEVNAIAFSAASGAANTSEFSTVTATILPVQFLSFDAVLKGDKVLVSWTTAQERNASHFEVQKSTDGQNFKTIGTVAAKGNSSRKVDYSFTDNSVEAGVSYYRLRQVDLDAKAIFTRVVPIRNEGRGKAFFVWPNPVIDVVNITINQTRPESLNIRVVDMSGRTMRTNKVSTVRGLNQVTLNLNGLQRGMYIIQVMGEETQLTQKILKD
ncbi:MAG TPA: T9SS type A sorting domain-containing protein [Chitinophagaceae bacterium]|nr:T9SS type A sorting domain-containing protein [Chitinophagaceae bacterium]